VRRGRNTHGVGEEVVGTNSSDERVAEFRVVEGDVMLDDTERLCR
jgi:hypothetical protein